MRLLLLTTLAMVAFAANSLLNRAALAGTGMDPAAFTLIRILSGAAMLAALALVRRGKLPLALGSAASAAALFVYAIAFSYAYLSLDAGIGALILFGGVQVTMFAGALRGGERPGARRWAGSALGLAGLAVLVAPSAAAPADPLGGALMLAAAAAWGIYSLRGRGVSDPLGATAANFVLAAPAAVAVWLLAGAAPPAPATGIALAVASGAIASGLGYAVWYGVLPRLPASTAAVAQLTVPLIAMVAGVLLLGETLPPVALPAAVLILGGVALASLRVRKTPAR